MKEDFAKNIALYRNLVALVRDGGLIMTAIITVIIAWQGGDPSQLRVTDWAYLVLASFSLALLPIALYRISKLVFDFLDERLYRPAPKYLHTERNADEASGHAKTFCKNSRIYKNQLSAIPYYTEVYFTSVHSYLLFVGLAFLFLQCGFEIYPIELRRSAKSVGYTSRASGQAVKNEADESPLW